MAKARNSNEGETGDESIRIQGKRVEELAPREQAQSRKQIEEQKRKLKRKEIMGRYPPYKVQGLKAQLKQCEDNLVKMRAVAQQEESTILEYRMWIRQCEMRDKELVSEGFEPR